MSIQSPEAFLGGLTGRGLSAWLLNACCSGATAPLSFPPEPSLPVALLQIFRRLDVPGQARFKSAVTLAVAEWHPHAHGPVCLADLAHLAALVRATGVIELLRVAILNNDLDTRESADRDALQVLLAVLMGFAPAPRVLRLFERLFFDETFDHHFAAQLFIGLCICRPQAVARFTSRFLSLRDRHPDAYRVDFVLHELCRVVGVGTIAKKMVRVEAKWQRDFLRLLAAEKWSPLGLVADRDATHLFLLTHPDQLFRLDDSLAVVGAAAHRQGMLREGVRATLLKQLSPSRSSAGP